MSTPTKFNLSKPTHLLAVGFGSGLLRPAPGTWGTAFAVLILYLMSLAIELTALQFSLLTTAIVLVGVPVCHLTAKDIGHHDHASIVWDEVAGMFVTMLLVPISSTTLLIGFVLFRFFDIVKPWPIRAVDQSVHGGVGIMLDDIIAGCLAGLALWLIVFYFGVG